MDPPVLMMAISIMFATAHVIFGTSLIASQLIPVIIMIVAKPQKLISTAPGPRGERISASTWNAGQRVPFWGSGGHR